MIHFHIFNIYIHSSLNPAFLRFYSLIFQVHLIPYLDICSINSIYGLPHNLLNHRNPISTCLLSSLTIYFTISALSLCPKFSNFYINPSPVSIPLPSLTIATTANLPNRLSDDYTILLYKLLCTGNVPYLTTSSIIVKCVDSSYAI